MTFKCSGRCLSRSRSGDLLVVLGVHVLDAGLGVEDRRPVVGQEVGGDDLLVGVALKRKTKKHFSFLVMRNNQ